MSEALPYILGGAALGGIGGAIIEHQDTKEQQRQINQQRKQIQDSANNIRALEAREGAAMQYAYNWASAMVNKYKRNPEAVSAISQQLATQLGQSSQQRAALRSTAQQLLAQRMAPLSDNYVKSAWARGMFKGLLSGAGAGYQAYGAIKDKSVNPGVDEVVDIITEPSPAPKQLAWKTTPPSPYANQYNLWLQQNK